MSQARRVVNEIAAMTFAVQVRRIKTLAALVCSQLESAILESQHAEFTALARRFLNFQFPKEHRPHDHGRSFYDWHPHL